MSSSEKSIRSTWIGILTISWTLGFTAWGITLTTLSSTTQAVEPSATKQNGEQSADSYSLARLLTDVHPLPETELASSDPIGHLFQWIENLANLAPEGESTAEQTAHSRKVARSVALAADRALKLKPSDEQARQGHLFKLQALCDLADLSDQADLCNKANRLLANAITMARNDHRPEVAAIGMKFLMESSMAKWSTLRSDKKSAILGHIVQYISQSELQPHHIQFLMNVTDFLDSSGDNHLAVQLLNRTLPQLRNSRDPEMVQSVTILKGLHRRLNLLGNKMEISGIQLDGTALDWTAYRGKIVLVYYWASWCGPCRLELPNVLKLYHAYHDKGFEVVGICLDNQRKSVDLFLMNQRIPWATLFSPQRSQINWAYHDWDHPLATHYGITGVPRAILIDRNGTVVDMNARGEQLYQQLRKRLGEPLAKARLIQDVMVRPVSGQSTRE
jgi:thiol-disulfide isomerase/thioredoxin